MIPNLPQYLHAACTEICDYTLQAWEDVVDNFNNMITALADWFGSSNFPNLIYQEADRTFYYIPPGGEIEAQPVPNMPNVFLSPETGLLTNTEGIALYPIQGNQIINNLFYDDAGEIYLRRVGENGAIIPTLPYAYCMRKAEGSEAIEFHNGSVWQAISAIEEGLLIAGDDGLIYRWDGSAWQEFWWEGAIRFNPADSSQQAYIGGQWEDI